MKAVVVEIKNKVAAVLKEDGTFAEYRGVCEVGDTVEVEDRAAGRGLFVLPGGIAAKDFRRYMPAVAAALAVAVGLGSYAYVYAAPVTYVSMDAGSSVEFALNRREEAVSVEALNADALDAVTTYKERQKGRTPLNEAVRVMTDILYEEQVLGADGQPVVSLNVASDDEEKNEKLLETAKAAVEEIQDAHREQPNVYGSTATKEERKEARKEGISAGAYKLREMGGLPELPKPGEMRENNGSGTDNTPVDGNGIDHAQESDGSQGNPPSGGEQPSHAPSDSGQNGGTENPRQAPENGQNGASSDGQGSGTDNPRKVPENGQNGTPSGGQGSGTVTPPQAPPDGQGGSSMDGQDSVQPPQGQQAPSDAGQGMPSYPETGDGEGRNVPPSDGGQIIQMPPDNGQGGGSQAPSDAGWASDSGQGMPSQSGGGQPPR